MKSLFILLFCFILVSCSQNNDDEIPTVRPGLVSDPDVVTDASGGEYPFLDPNVLSYCGPGWGRKFCRFLKKHDGTIWADAENYYSDFSDIEFSKFTINEYFISFFNLDPTTTTCEGWKIGETVRDGIKWDIKIKKDEEDKFWFDYEYYGSSEEIENTITYKYEVIDGLLHFSTTEGLTFIFHPSERNYTEELLETGEVIRLDGCMFY